MSKSPVDQVMEAEVEAVKKVRTIIETAVAGLKEVQAQENLLPNQMSSARSAAEQLIGSLTMNLQMQVTDAERRMNLTPNSIPGL